MEEEYQLIATAKPLEKLRRFDLVYSPLSHLIRKVLYVYRKKGEVCYILSFASKNRRVFLKMKIEKDKIPPQNTLLVSEMRRMGFVHVRLQKWKDGVHCKSCEKVLRYWNTSGYCNKHHHEKNRKKICDKTGSASTVGNTKRRNR